MEETDPIKLLELCLLADGRVLNTRERIRLLELLRLHYLELLRLDQQNCGEYDIDPSMFEGDAPGLKVQALSKRRFRAV